MESLIRDGGEQNRVSSVRKPGPTDLIPHIDKPSYIPHELFSPVIWEVVFIICLLLNLISVLVSTDIPGFHLVFIRRIHSRVRTFAQVELLITKS
jgi:hypothetical protein